MTGEKLYQKSWPYTWCVKMEMEALVRFQMYFPIGTFRHFRHLNKSTYVDITHLKQCYQCKLPKIIAQLEIKTPPPPPLPLVT